jgi:hypothetical protein
MSGDAMPAAGDRELDRAPEPGTVVPCPLKQGARIGVGRCVEWQRDNGCHCEHALVALSATKKHLEHPHQSTESEDAAAERAEQLDAVRELIRRAEQLERVRPKPEPPVPRFDPRGLPEGGLRRQVIPKQQQLATPAKERDVASLTDRTCEWKEGPCSERLGNQNKSGLCNRHNSVLYMRKRAAEERGEEPPRAKPAGNGHAKRTVTARKPKPPPSAPAVLDDVASLLQRQRDHYAAQLARIDRAIAALRD